MFVNKTKGPVASAQTQSVSLAKRTEPVLLEKLEAGRSYEQDGKTTQFLQNAMN